MKTLIVTVAGTATRFNKDTDSDTLKCIYYKELPQYSLLYQIVEKSADIDKILIVGGYLYQELSRFIAEFPDNMRSKIELIYNPYFIEYGSGYSLIKGIEAVQETDEIIFVEGDLYFDDISYRKIVESDKNVITINTEPILAEKAVAFYINETSKINYLYDTNHQSLHIAEPFKGIYNSAQIWKFKSLNKLKNIISSLNDLQIKGTNLEIVQGYFGDIPTDELDIVTVHEWRNCNTVEDYMNVYKHIKQHGEFK